MTENPKFFVGPPDGLPTLDDLVALFRQLTGREPSAEDLAAAKAEMAALLNRDLQQETLPVTIQSRCEEASSEKRQRPRKRKNQRV
jgi:hypothetical protein